MSFWPNRGVLKGLADNALEYIEMLFLSCHGHELLAGKDQAGGHDRGRQGQGACAGGNTADFFSDHSGGPVPVLHGSSGFAKPQMHGTQRRLWRTIIPSGQTRRQ